MQGQPVERGDLGSARDEALADPLHRHGGIHEQSLATDGSKKECRASPALAVRAMVGAGAHRKVRSKSRIICGVVGSMAMLLPLSLTFASQNRCLRHLKPCAT